MQCQYARPVVISLHLLVPSQCVVAAGKRAVALQDFYVTCWHIWHSAQLRRMRRCMYMLGMRGEWAFRTGERQITNKTRRREGKEEGCVRSKDNHHRTVDM